MTLIHSIILGIIEGITEFLPISSTGHLILVSKLLNIVQTDFVKTFEIVIQLGAMLSVVWIYRKKIFPLDVILWKKVIVSFIPTAAIGFVLYKIIKVFLLGNASIVAWALIIGGIIIMFFEKLHKENFSSLTIDQELRALSYKNAFIIGVAQSLAVIPGVSRSAATILSGQSLRLSRKAIVEYSFLLAIPTMAAASGYDILKSASSFVSADVFALTIGFIVSFITALVAVKFLLRYIERHNFFYFGLYRIIIGLIFLLAFAF